MYKCRIYALLHVKSDIIRKFSLSFLKKSFIFSLFSRFSLSYPGFSHLRRSLICTIRFILSCFHFIFVHIAQFVDWLASCIFCEKCIFMQKIAQKSTFSARKSARKWGFSVPRKSTLFVEKCRKSHKWDFSTDPKKSHFTDTCQVCPYGRENGLHGLLSRQARNYPPNTRKASTGRLRARVGVFRPWFVL